MHVKHIESNIKGGVDLPLGEKTLIVGPNGQGKSAVVNAIELALGGSASDIVGRDEVKREADLLALTQGEKLTATATLEDGDTASIEIQPNGRGGAKKAKMTGDVLASFPVRDVRAALGGSPDTARKWLLSRVASSVTREDVLAWFSPEGSELYGVMAKQLHGNEIDKLLGVLASASSDVRSKKKEISTIKEVLERSGSTLDTEPTAAMISDAETLTQKALSDYEESMKNSHYEMAEENALKLVKEAEQAIEALATAQTDWDLVKDLTPPGDRPTDKQLDVVDRIQAIRGIHQMHTDLSFDGCLVCERDGTIDHANLAHEKGEIIEGIYAIQEWWRVYDQVAGAKNDASTRAVAAVEAANEAKATLQGLSKPEEEGADKKSLWEAAHMRETALKEVSKQWKVIRSQRDETRMLRADISNLEEVIDGAKQAISRLLKNAIDSFSKSVQGYLPASDMFELRLEEKGKEVCKLGFNRDGFLHTALSGAEWARLTLAIACAASENTDGLRIFTPEERAFDPATLRDVMAALSEAPGQVIITSPIKHKGRLPKGWTVIDLEEKAAEAHSTPSLDDASPSLA